MYAWLLAVALWSFLPSPTIRYEHERLHNERILRAGLPLTTVDTEPSIAGGFFVLQWELTTVLRIGENPGIDIADLLRKNDKFHLSKIKNDAVWTPVFGLTTIKLEVPYVPEIDCSDVCLPWFNRNDKVLLTHQLHGGTRIMEVRVVVVEQRVVEIWPDSTINSVMAELKEARKKPEAASYTEGQLLEEALQHLRGLGRPLIQIGGIRTGDKEQITVPYLRGYLPSKSYHIRRALLARVGLVIRIILFPVRCFGRVLSTIPQVLLFILLEGGLACAGIMLSCWLRDGRPAFKPWTRKFWMTRWIYLRTNKSQRVWGPTGPVESKRSEQDEWKPNRFTGLQRPKNARFGRGWNAV